MSNKLYLNVKIAVRIHKYAGVPGKQINFDALLFDSGFLFMFFHPVKLKEYIGRHRYREVKKCDFIPCTQELHLQYITP